MPRRFNFDESPPPVLPAKVKPKVRRASRQDYAHQGLVRGWVVIADAQEVGSRAAPPELLELPRDVQALIVSLPDAPTAAARLAAVIALNHRLKIMRTPISTRHRALLDAARG